LASHRLPTLAATQQAVKALWKSPLDIHGVYSMIRHAPTVAISAVVLTALVDFAFVMTALAEDPPPEPRPCAFAKPIRIRELAEAMNNGCYLATGTIIRVPVDDVYPGEPGYGEGEPVTLPDEPVPPPDLSNSEVEQLDATVAWLISHPKIVRVRVEVYLPDLEMTWQEAEATSMARAQGVVEYLVAKGVTRDRIDYAGRGVSENGIARIDFVVLEVRKEPKP